MRFHIHIQSPNAKRATTKKQATDATTEPNRQESRAPAYMRGPDKMIVQYMQKRTWQRQEERMYMVRVRWRTRIRAQKVE